MNTTIETPLDAERACNDTSGEREIARTLQQIVSRNRGSIDPGVCVAAAELDLIYLRDGQWNFTAAGLRFVWAMGV